MIRYQEHNAEVLYAEDQVVQVDRQDIEHLVQRALLNPRQRIRLCAHRDTQDPLHEMLIVHARDCYVRPHKHLAKSEAFHIIQGVADVILFDDAGQVLVVVPMGDYATGRKFYYRLTEPRYHTLLIRSDYVVFHEITNGPFNREDTRFAPWAPEEGEAAQNYLEALARKVPR